MTPDERTALNEAVCKRLGWVQDESGWWRVNQYGAYHITTVYVRHATTYYGYVLGAVWERNEGC